MTNILRKLSTVALVAVAAGCATVPSGTEVTRFHLGQPIARSTIALVPADGTAAFSLEYRSYADAVAAELRAQSFVPVGNEPGSAYVGTITLAQTGRPARRRGGLSIGIGGGSFGHDGGVGGSVAIPIGQGPAEIVSTTLGLQIRRRSDNSIVWEGRAVDDTGGGSRAADLPVAVPRLAHALLDGFPGPAGQTVRVQARK